MNNPVYTPEFIPYYVAEVKQNGLTPTEGLVYGFVRFYTKNGSPFYFSNSHIAKMLGCSESVITKAVSRIKKIGLFQITYQGKKTGGEIRFINPASKIYHRPDPDSKIYYTRSENLPSAPEESGVQNKRENKRKLSLENLDGIALGKEFEVLPSAIERVAKKFLYHCEDKNKVPTLSGLKYWLSNENWLEEDFSIAKQNRLAREAIMNGEW